MGKSGSARNVRWTAARAELKEAKARRRTRAQAHAKLMSEQQTEAKERREKAAAEKAAEDAQVAACIGASTTIETAPTEAELQGILDDGKPREIVTQEDGSIKAVESKVE